MRGDVEEEVHRFLEGFCRKGAVGFDGDGEVQEVYGGSALNVGPFEFACVIHVKLEVLPGVRVVWVVDPNAEDVINLSFVEE